MQKEIITLAVCLTVVLSSTIIGAFMYNINDRNNMSKNIETAISKGIDPISVKCAYETNANSVCAVFAATGKK